MKKRIPSKWTKGMFLSASFYAMLTNDSEVCYRVMHDLHDILLFGFSFWRNGEFDESSLDYTQFSVDLFRS